MDINTLYGIFAAAGLSMIIMFFQNLNRKKSWKGTVTKIKKLESSDNHEFYKVYYRTDTGKKGKINLRDDLLESKFSNLQVDSILIKVAGQDYPELLK